MNNILANAVNARDSFVQYIFDTAKVQDALYFPFDSLVTYKEALYYLKKLQPDIFPNGKNYSLIPCEKTLDILLMFTDLPEWPQEFKNIWSAHHSRHNLMLDAIHERSGKLDAKDVIQSVKIRFGYGQEVLECEDWFDAILRRLVFSNSITHVDDFFDKLDLPQPAIPPGRVYKYTHLGFDKMFESEKRKELYSLLVKLKRPKMDNLLNRIKHLPTKDGDKFGGLSFKQATKTMVSNKSIFILSIPDAAEAVAKCLQESMLDETIERLKLDRDIGKFAPKD